MEKFRGLRKDFVNCTSECCIEENFNRIQDMYGYDHSYSYDNSGYEDGVEMFFKHLNPDGYFRVSDTAPAYKDIIGATYTAPTPSGNTQPLEVTEDFVEWIVEEKVLSVFGNVIVVFEDCDYKRNHYFKGVYFLPRWGTPESLFKTIRKSIDPKFLPEGYPYETVGLVEIIPEMSVTVMSMGVGMSMGQVPTPPEIASYEGKTVTVKLNGIEYECELNSFNDALVCGNLSFAGLEGGEEFPFALSFQPENGFSGIVTQDEVETNYTFSLSGEGTVAVPMAEKFLPAGIGGGDMLSVAIVYDGSSYTCNKTYEEVDNALNNNIPIYAIYAEYTSGRRRQCLYREVRHGSNGRILFVGNEYDVDLDLYTNNEVHPEELES